LHGRLHKNESWRIRNPARDKRPAACHHVSLGMSLLRGGCGSNSRQSSLNPWRRRKSNSLEPVCAARGVEEFSVISVRSNANGFASPRLHEEEVRLVRFTIYRDAESGRSHASRA